MENQSPSRVELWRYPLLFLAPFIFLLTGLNPSFYADDSPETVTACVTLGIPHPPGYPIYTLLGRLFSLIPLAHFTFRVNLLAAALSALVCVLLFGFLSQSLRVSPRMAAFFSLLWAVGATSYPAALSAKTGIYQFTTLFLVGILWALFEGRLAMVFFLLGLSLANHWMTMLVFLPGFGIILYSHIKEKGIETKDLLKILTMALMGLSLYLFLPLRASQNPMLNWGNPSTWNNFTFDFLRSQYANPMEGDAGDKLAQMGAALRVSTLEFLILFPLALWGAWVVFYRNKIQAIGVATLWVGLVLAVGVFLYVPGDELYLIAGFLLPAQVFILLFSAWGLECALTVKDSALRVKIEKRIIAALVLLLAILGGYRLSHDRQTDYTYDYDYALNDIKTVPKGGLYFCKGDAVVFPCWYFQWVEQKRSDLVVIGVDGIPMDWVRRNLALFHPGLKVPRTAQKVGVESIPTLAKWMVDQNKWRELYFSYNEGADNLLLGVKTLPYGLAEKGYFPEDQAAFDEGKATLCWSSLRLRHMKDEKFPVDGRTLDLIVKDYSVYRNSLGIFYEDMGDDAKTKMNSHPKVEDFLKVQNDYQQSLESYQWAAEWDPEEPKYAFNQGNANYHVGKIDEAIACYGRAVRLNPKYTVAYENWAIVAFQTGRYSEAEGLFKKVLELKPDDAQAQQGLERLKQLGQLK